MTAKKSESSTTLPLPVSVRLRKITEQQKLLQSRFNDILVSCLEGMGVKNQEISDVNLDTGIVTFANKDNGQVPTGSGLKVVK